MPNIEKNGIVYDPVGEYPEKTDDIRSDEETKLAENRSDTDQDPTYRERLDLSVQDMDMNTLAELQREAAAQALGVKVEDVPQVSIPVVEPAPETSEG